MTTPRLPEGIENAVKDLVIASTRVLTSEAEKQAQIVFLTELLTTLRREIAAALEERAAQQHAEDCPNPHWPSALTNKARCHVLDNLRASAAAIRRGEDA